MKKFTSFALLLSICVVLSSCLKDKCQHTYTMYRPVYKSLAEVRANIKSNAPKAVERPGKIYVRGQYIFLNEIDKGIHVIDNSNPASPKNVSFIDIPGNIDLAVKGNSLYADCFMDMVTLDITNPVQVTAKKFTDDVFPFRKYGNGFLGDSNKIIVDWIRKDTTVAFDCDGGQYFLANCPNCSGLPQAFYASDKSASPFGAGVGGSMARFTLLNDYLYTVTDQLLNVFDINSPNDPQLINKVNIGWSIETISPFKDKLFIGSSSAMFIFSTADPGNPAPLGQFTHMRVCDPVIADDLYAYVTLRSGTRCQGFTNQLDVLDIANINYPVLLKSYQLTNPHGLSKDGNTLFICDGDDGLKMFDATSPSDIKLLKQIRNINAYDVIAFNKLALVVGEDGLYQFDYSKLDNLKLLSKISYQK
jgi:hypothetical protein